jgi:hypothetical protein
MNVEFRTRRATGAACWEALKYEWENAFRPEGLGEC